MAMAVASLPFSRLSLRTSSNSPTSSCLAFTSKQGSMRLASSHSFATTQLGNVPCKESFSSGVRIHSFVTFAAAAPTTKKKTDSAVKRALQAEKRRIYHKSRKSELHTRMKKVFLAMDNLKKDTAASVEMLYPIETLIGEAFSTIDKAVKVGTLHRNTGARRKSRLSRAKKVLEVQMGWYTPSPAPTAAA